MEQSELSPVLHGAVPEMRQYVDVSRDNRGGYLMDEYAKALAYYQEQSEKCAAVSVSVESRLYWQGKADGFSYAQMLYHDFRKDQAEHATV